MPLDVFFPGRWSVTIWQEISFSTFNCTSRRGCLLFSSNTEEQLQKEDMQERGCLWFELQNEA